MPAAGRVHPAGGGGAVGRWTEQVVPRIANRTLDTDQVRTVRAFVEHGRAPDPGVRRWQARLEPLNRRIAGGCHLTRPVDELLVGAGFTLERLDRDYLPKEPKPFASLYEGLARV